MRKTLACPTNGFGRGIILVQFGLEVHREWYGNSCSAGV
jgi:hypothetical protein